MLSPLRDKIYRVKENKAIENIEISLKPQYGTKH